MRITLERERIGSKISCMARHERALRKQLARTEFSSDDWRIRALDWVRHVALPAARRLANAHLENGLDCNAERKVEQALDEAAAGLFEVEKAFWARVELGSFRILETKELL